MGKSSKHFYEFGPFRLDAGERTLLRDGRPVPLTLKDFEMLLVLVENSGHVLEKDELMKHLWPDSFVEEANLSHHVFTLRKALGEDKSGSKYIETVARRGYRFVASVSEVRGENVDLVVEEHSQAHIVINEETETGSTISDAGAEQATENKALTVKPLVRSWIRRSTSLVVITCVVAVGLSIAAYFWLSGGSKQMGQTKTAAAIRSIAVLPFKPLAADSRDENVEMGMADTLITKLGNLRQIIVRPISAVRKYSALDQDPLAAGRELGVDAVLDGSIQWDGGHRIRVTNRLVRVVDGAQLWAETCEEQCTNIFAAQDSISQKVAAALVVQLTGEEKQRLAKHYTENTEAYQLYLLGRFFWNKRTTDGYKKGIEYFEQAIDKDPAFALAYSGLADCYTLLGSSAILPANETFPKARAAAEKALEIDDSLAEAHTSLANVKGRTGDWSGAEAEFKRAIELNPNYDLAHHWYAMLLGYEGRLDEAMAGMRRALEIDPLSLPSNTQVGRVFWWLGQYDEAIAQYKKVLEMNPNFAIAHWQLGWAYEQKGMYEEAIAAYQKAIDLGGRPTIVAEIGRAYALWGKRREALKVLRELKQMSKKGYVPAYDFALIYAGLGEKEQAIDWIEKGYADGAGHMGLKMNPQWDSLRSHPRFQALLRRMGLAQ